MDEKLVLVIIYNFTLALLAALVEGQPIAAPVTNKDAHALGLRISEVHVIIAYLE